MVSIITLMPLIPESGANIGNETVDFEGTFCHEAELKTITFPPLNLRPACRGRYCKRRGTNDVCNSDPHLLLSGTRNSSVLKSDFVPPPPLTPQKSYVYIAPKYVSLLNFIPEKARISAGRPSEQKSRLV